MYAGAFVGFWAAERSGSLWIGVAAAVVAGALAGALMGLLTVTIGVNQHVAGIGTTLGLIAASDYANRLLYSTGSLARSPKFSRWFPGSAIFGQFPPTYFAFLVLAPAVWWVLRTTGAGMRLRAVGENPEAADVAGISVAGTRYGALVAGGMLMAAGGAFLTLALLGSFTIEIVSGRGWVCIALVIFGRWRVWRGVAGALIFAGVFSLALRLGLMPGGDLIPPEVLLALPYLAVILALAISGRNVAYPGAYLKPYRRT
jgi:simple sugar transport system permease protein